ncbi:MAG TPA: class I SAM-dependent methyltransferase [Candidatus Nitrosocosmicus sp.]|nr:class I SAM-dependent methyltransferase [Candidatus Nitrosocosmicus sp.]
MKVKGLQDTIQWYDTHAKEYADKITNVYNEDSINAFTHLLPSDPYVLDAGCGAGRHVKLLSQKGAKVIGIDISKGLLEEAKKRNPEIEFLYGDITQIPFDDKTFDGVWSHASIVHLEKEEDVHAALCEFHRILKDNGILHLHVKEQQGTADTEVISDILSNHERFFRFYTKEGLSNMLQKIGFDIYKITSSDDPHGRKEVQWLTFLAKK